MDGGMGNMEYWRIHFLLPYFCLPVSGCWGFPVLYDVPWRGMERDLVWIVVARYLNDTADNKTKVTTIKTQAK